MNWSAGKVGTINQRAAHANGLSTPPIGCVLHLPGLPGGGSKIYDRSPYGNVGTIIGATWTRLPSGLWVMSFDGDDDYVNCGSGTSLNIIAEMSIEAWVKRDTIDALMRIVGLDEAETRGYEFGWRANNKLAFTYYGIADVESSGPAFTDTTNWHQVAVVKTGSTGNWTYTFYVDGVVDGTNTSAQNVPARTKATRIGSSVDAFYFDGFIALPRVYNRALSALEIQNHFNREKHLFGVW